jgi:peptide-methionine (S)-S-oxide reductase
MRIRIAALAVAALIAVITTGLLAHFSLNGPSGLPEKFPAPAFTPPQTFPAPESATSAAKSETATFGSGCFWCAEAVFQRLQGVQSVTSGYSGGKVANPSYDDVCSGDTGHAEVVQVVFDPAVISYPELLEVFWRSHDPTTLNRQGHDVGTQYRSVVLYHSAEQRRLAEDYKRQIDDAHVFDRPVVTEITAFKAFYPAEDYHQNYFATHGRNPYCQAVIRPKVEHLERVFGKKLKSAGN